MRSICVFENTNDWLKINKYFLQVMGETLDQKLVIILILAMIISGAGNTIGTH